MTSFSVVLDDVAADLRDRLPSGFALVVCSPEHWRADQLKQTIDILRGRWEGNLDSWENLLRRDGDLCLLKMRGDLVEGYTVFRLLVAPDDSAFCHASVLQFVLTVVNEQGVGTATALQRESRAMHAQLSRVYGKPDRYELVYCDASSVGFWVKQYASGWRRDPAALEAFERASPWLSPELAMVERGAVVPLMHRQLARVEKKIESLLKERRRDVHGRRV